MGNIGDGPLEAQLGIVANGLRALGKRLGRRPPRNCLRGQPRVGTWQDCMPLDRNRPRAALSPTPGQRFYDVGHSVRGPVLQERPVELVSGV